MQSYKVRFEEIMLLNKIRDWLPACAAGASVIAVTVTNHAPMIFAGRSLIIQSYKKYLHFSCNICSTLNQNADANFPELSRWAILLLATGFAGTAAVIIAKKHFYTKRQA